MYNIINSLRYILSRGETKDHSDALHTDYKLEWCTIPHILCNIIINAQHHVYITHLQRLSCMTYSFYKLPSCGTDPHRAVLPSTSNSIAYICMPKYKKSVSHIEQAFRIHYTNISMLQDTEHKDCAWRAACWTNI